AMHDAHDGVDRVWIGGLTHASPQARGIPSRAKIAPTDHPATVGVAHFEVFVGVGAVIYRCDHVHIEPDATASRLGHEPGVSILEHRDEAASGGLQMRAACGRVTKRSELRARRDSPMQLYRGFPRPPPADRT